MNERFQTLFGGFTERWQMISFTQKIMVGTLILALVIAGVFVFFKANDDYDILYSNMSIPDAAATVAKLKEMKVPFKVIDNGTTVMVPRGQKNQLVLDTANELTSEQTINLSKIPPVVQGDVQKEWIKKINTQEISGILQGINGIKTAQVIVSTPEHNVFEEEEDPVTASVMIRTEPGFRLRDEQVKVIKNLVSHSVPGLKAENVVIADGSGNPLEGPGLNVASGNSEADKRQKSFEEKTAKKIMGILTPVVGKGNAVVSVSALLNFDQSEAEIHRVIPLGGTSESPTGLAVSTQSQVEEYNGEKKAGVGGAVGVESNVPSYQASSTEKGKDSNYKMTKTTTNFTNSEEHKKVIYAPGQVERLTVAVVLNKVLTAKETDEIRDLVANAAGLDESRGDSIDIKGFQFSQPPEDAESQLAAASKAAQEQAFYLQLASYGAVLLLGLTALFIFYSLFKKPAEGEIVQDEAYETYYDETPALLEETPIPSIEARLDPEIEHMREAINNLVVDDPSEVARVLVTYMKEA
ncbi:MAG: flagellar basal-body MS-ring/collar protein FliF [Vampirovibrionales bacterium]|nr:flagellar basal-body MS-ring/collar protein FliF [Vampirovibrionales bacterium]